MLLKSPFLPAFFFFLTVFIVIIVFGEVRWAISRISLCLVKD